MIVRDPKNRLIGSKKKHYIILIFGLKTTRYLPTHHPDSMCSIRSSILLHSLLVKTCKMLFLCGHFVVGRKPVFITLLVLLPFECNYYGVTDPNRFMYVKYDLSSASSKPMSSDWNVQPLKGNCDDFSVWAISVVLEKQIICLTFFN